MIKRIIFVESSVIKENKPLDRATKNGWLVDRMSWKLDIPCVKSALFEIDGGIPRKDRERISESAAFSGWMERFGVGDSVETLLVTFGKAPDRIFGEMWTGARVHLPFVGQLPSDEKMTKYVDECVEKILQKLKELEG